ncbi:MAG: twin-arginine translocase subunit TatC [Caldisericia bacterium]
MAADDLRAISEHLEELRKRLLWSVFFVLTCAVVAWWQYPNIYHFFTMSVPSLGVPEIKLHALTITEAFTTR